MIIITYRYLSVKESSTSFVTIPIVSLSENLTVTPIYYSDINSLDRQQFQTTNTMNGKITANIRPFYNRLFFKSLFGSETSKSTYYLYAPSFTNLPISLRVDDTSDNLNYLTMQYDECYVNSIDLSMTTNEFVKIDVDWIAYDYSSINSYSISPPYSEIDEKPLPFYKVDIEMATGISSLTDAYLKSASINFTKSPTDEFLVNSIMPQERYNSGAFAISGSLEFNSTDYDKFAYQIESESMVDIEFKLILYDADNIKKIEIYFESINFIKTDRKTEKLNGTKSVSFIANPTNSYIKIYK